MNSNSPPRWPPQYPPSHSVEIEHRLTEVTIHLDHAKEMCEDRHEDATESIVEVDKKHEEALAAVRKRMSNLERAVLALAFVMNVALQKEYPGIAKAIRGILLP